MFSLLDTFKADLWGVCVHFSNFHEQKQDQSKVPPHVNFIGKLIRNLSQKFEFGKQHLLLMIYSSWKW